MKVKSLNLILGLFVLALIIKSCKDEVASTASPTSKEPSVATAKEEGQAFIKGDESRPTVLQIAMESEMHTILVAAVQAADLENVLVNAGPLMVFAPTNEAFDALPEGTLENLLKPENKQKLATILKHHVTAGKYEKEFLKNFKKLGQADDTNTTVVIKGEDVYVGGAKIIASIDAGNGIVHVVDKVMIPQQQ